MTTTILNAATFNAGTWTASAGTALACIQTPDDSAWIESGAVGSAFFTITPPGLDSEAVITAVRLCARARLTTAGVHNYIGGIRVRGATTMTVGPYPINTTSWAIYTWEWTQNPETEAAWTPADIDAISRVYLTDGAAGTTTHIDHLYLEVDYTTPAAPIELPLAAVSGWTTVEGDNRLAALSDDTDTTWISTGPNPDGETLNLTLPPLATPDTDLQLTVRLGATGGSITITPGLHDPQTPAWIDLGPIEVTGSPSDRTLTWNIGDLTAITAGQWAEGIQVRLVAGV